MLLRGMVVSAGGHDSVTLGASLTDVLSLSGQVLSAVDAGSDKLLFWDDSAGEVTHATVGGGLAMTGTTIAANSKIGAVKASLYTGAAQVLTDSYADVDGSSVTISPSANPSELLYKFSFTLKSTSATDFGIGHFKLFRDGSEIVTARTPVYIYIGVDGRYTYEFLVGNASTSSTTFKLQARRHSSTYPLTLHETRLWDGAASAQASSATVSIIETLP